MSFKEMINEGSTKEYVKTSLENQFAGEGVGFTVERNIGFDKYFLDNNVTVINDGSGIEVKVDGKSIYYGDRPKLDYKKALEVVYNEIY